MKKYFKEAKDKYTDIVDIPTGFFDGKVKHIVVEYESLTESKMYIDGIEMQKIDDTDGFSSGVGDTPYLGRRGQGDYFNGTIYSFDIYNKILIRYYKV